MAPKPVFVLAMLAVLGAGVVAQAASHDRDTFIREQDLDGDGKVTKAEYASGRAKEFARMDANGDGGISRAEYIADFTTRVDQVVAGYPAERRTEQKARELRQVSPRFDVLDSDKSGAITVAEFGKTGQMMFDMHETNGDGVVSKDDPIPKR